LGEFSGFTLNCEENLIGGIWFWCFGRGSTWGGEEGGPIVCNWEFICCTTPYGVGLGPNGRGGLLRTASSGRAVCEGTTRGTRCSKGTTKGREF
jgi:hypothetical protein